MRKYFATGSNYGKLVLLIGLLMGVPLVVLPFNQDEMHYAPAFLIPMGLSVVLGISICLKTYKQKETILEWQSPLQRGSLPVLFVWFYSFLMGALPFYISRQLDFTRSLYESISGWTTTGLTVVDVTLLPKIFLFHRSYMQYCGGLGFIVMIVMFVQGNQSMSLYSAEGHNDRIKPNLKQTSRIIFMLYSVLLLVGTLLYRLFGMEMFDAVCHAMSALSTAGFSTKPGSIGEYASLPIEMVTIVLMLIGASNFAALLLLAEGKVRQVFRVTEMRFMMWLIAAFVPLMAFSLVKDMGMGTFESIHQALFGVVTTFSTTGYSTMDYSKWPPFATGLIILLMFIGGSAGSTAGGIKLSRTYFIIRITYENIRSRLSPSRRVVAPTYNTALGKAPIDNALIADTFGFIACYMGVFIIGTLLVTLTAGCSLYDAMFEFASALGTIGLTDGLTNINTNVATMLVEMAGMILGRLEVFIVFVGFYSGVRVIRLMRWKRRNADSTEQSAESEE